jgi:hypothetical protein
VTLANVAQGARDIGMIGGVHAIEDGQGSLKELHGASVLAESEQAHAHLVEELTDARVIRAVLVQAHVHLVGSLVVLQRLGRQARFQKAVGQVDQGLGQSRIRGRTRPEVPIQKKIGNL